MFEVFFHGFFFFFFFFFILIHSGPDGTTRASASSPLFSIHNRAPLRRLCGTELQLHRSCHYGCHCVASMDLGWSVGDSHSCSTHAHEETSKTSSVCVCVCARERVRFQLSSSGEPLQEYGHCAFLVISIYFYFYFFLSISLLYEAYFSAQIFFRTSYGRL